MAHSYLYWHRNLSRGKGFFINGHIHHYPDFIIVTNKHNVIVVETKGNHLANQEPKIELGNRWAELATRHGGDREYAYLMLFNEHPIRGGHDMAGALAVIRAL